MPESAPIGRFHPNHVTSDNTEASVWMYLQSGIAIAKLVSRVAAFSKKTAGLEPERLRFFETFEVKFRLFSVGQTELDS